MGRACIAGYRGLPALAWLRVAQWDTYRDKRAVVDVAGKLVSRIL